MTYNSIHSHQGMHFDHTRNEAYFKALQAVITPDSVVLDLGAGLGIHGLLAAKLGAKKVYMVEPADVIHVAEKLVLANGFSDRVECIKGSIEEVSLPEQVDVIISVFTGNFLLEEDLLPSLFYARDNYLKPNGVMIPEAAVMEAVPVSAPELYHEQVGIWTQAYYDLDFSLVQRYTANALYYNRPALKKATYLADTCQLMSLDFHAAQQIDCRSSAEYKITSDQLCHGIAGWFKIKLGDIWLSTAPHETKVHWSPAFLPFDPPFDLRKGEKLKFYLARQVHDHWIWCGSTQKNEQKHSTFISETLSVKSIRKTYPDYQPTRSLQGELVYDIITCFDGKILTQEIAKKITKKYPDLQLSKTQLIRLISDLIQQYSK